MLYMFIANDLMRRSVMLLKYFWCVKVDYPLH